jgi:hypothetical protein
VIGLQRRTKVPYPLERFHNICEKQYCSRYIVGTRGKGEVNTGTNHLGFRCVKDPVIKNRAAVGLKSYFRFSPY